MKDRSEIDQEYLKEQQARMSSYKIGGMNPSGQKIIKIYSKGNEYMVYDIEAGNPIESLRVLIDTREETDREPLLRYNEVKDEFDKFKSVMYKTGADSSYKHRAAHAISVAIEGEPEKSKNLFKQIQDEIIKEFREMLYGRVSYFSGAFIFVLILTILSLLAYLCREHQFVHSNSLLFEYLAGITFAGYGGIFSISVRIKEIFVEKALRNWMFIAYGAERLLFSVVGGIAAVTLIKAELFLSSLTKGEQELFVTLSVCFISGFSETLIPNTLRKIEGRESENSNN